MVAFKGHFDGRVIVPDEPVTIPLDRQLTFNVEVGADSPQNPITLAELAKSEFPGSWSNRDDIVDSVDFVNEMRRKMENREL